MLEDLKKERMKTDKSGIGESKAEKPESSHLADSIASRPVVTDSVVVETIVSDSTAVVPSG